MSAIAKPCLFFSTALTQAQKDEPVNVEDIKGLSKLNAGALLSNPATYHILVAMRKPGQDKKFDFVDAATRDTAFSAAKALIAASV